METKICSKCGRELIIEEFPFRDKKKGTRRADCKQCHSQIMKDKYKENKQQLNELKKQGCCEKCGYNLCVEVLEYHHKEPEEKIDNVSKLITHSSLITSLTEIKKCILFCANCHREFHFLERNKENFSLQDFLDNKYSNEDFKI